MSNVFSFTGTLGRDAEVRYTPAGMAVLSANVANNIGYGDRQQTLWIQVSVFGKRAEGQLANYLKKGQQVFVSGELGMNEYQAKDGTTKNSLTLNANILDLVGKRDGSQQATQQAAPPPQQSRPTTQSAPPARNAPPLDDFGDIPF